MLPALRTGESLSDNNGWDDLGKNSHSQLCKVHSRHLPSQLAEILLPTPPQRGGTTEWITIATRTQHHAATSERTS